MKIIREGCIEKTIKRYHFECVDCGCIFECEDNEVEKRPAEYNSTDICYNCPTCKRSILGDQIIYRG